MKNNNIYTAGELAKMAGVSVRTIRFYDTKGILPAVTRSENGYRQYDAQSADRLQKILMLKFLGFSLEQISDIMKSEQCADIRASLQQQEKLLKDKRIVIDRIIGAIEEAEQTDDLHLYEKLFEIMRAISHAEDIYNQYADEVNLQRRNELA